MTEWRVALELNAERKVVAGTEDDLAKAIEHGADLRVGTAFRHNEHIDVTSESPELIRESMDFRLTWLLDKRWATGIITLRQPIELPSGFGSRPSMSFFMYNQDARQSIARVFLDGNPASGPPGPSPPLAPPGMPKYHVEDSWDGDTNAPSSNFVYDFDMYRFYVRNNWREVLSHAADGTVISGSIDTLADAFSEGCDVKVGVSGIANALATDKETVPHHELFVSGGSCYYYTEQKLFISGTHPIVRLTPTIPLAYTTRAWDFGWLMVRSDGRVVYRRCDPYTLEFTDIELRCAVRWFVN